MMTLEKMIEAIELAPREDVAPIAATAVNRVVADGNTRYFLRLLNLLSQDAVSELTAYCEDADEGSL